MWTIPKTEPVGDSLQSTALRSTDDNDDDDDNEIVSINSMEKNAFHPPRYVAPQFLQKITTF